jgi:RHS repeat-associated protein
VATYTYDAFGELLDSTGEVENDYLFAGEQFDGELEQYYLRQRFYDAGVGRFTRRDTYEGRIGEPVTLHKYLYGNANPVNFVDPSGLYSVGELSAAIVVNTILLTTLFASPTALDERVLYPNANPQLTDLIENHSHRGNSGVVRIYNQQLSNWGHAWFEAWGWYVRIVDINTIEPVLGPIIYKANLIGGGISNIRAGGTSGLFPTLDVKNHNTPNFEYVREIKFKW